MLPLFIENLRLPPSLKQVRTEEEMDLVNKLRQKVYSHHFPEIQDSCDDPYDQHAVVIAGWNSDFSSVHTTGRFVLDSAIGLPEESIVKPHIKSLREDGCRLAEAGRFVISSDHNTNNMLRDVYRACYEVARALSVSRVLLTHKDKDVVFHRRVLSAQQLPVRVSNLFGGPHSMSVSCWDINRTPARFFSWTQESMNEYSEGSSCE